MICPHCNQPLTEAEIKRIWASYTGKKQTPHAGPGRGKKAQPEPPPRVLVPIDEA